MVFFNAHTFLLLIAWVGFQVSGSLHSYVIVIDAGSSGSRIHCLSYVIKNGAPVFDVKPNNKKVKPGLNAFQDDPLQAKAKIAELIDWAQEQVPIIRWEHTPVYLKATAGLRSVPIESAEIILKHCSEVIQSSPFEFHRGYARIITGQEEGIFGWITANYLGGYLHPDQSDSIFASDFASDSGFSSLTSPYVSSPIGVVEMGGYSLQITFSPQHDQISSDELFEFKINGISYSVYTHSFMGFGLEAVQDTFFEKADFESSGELNPCYPKGYVFRGVEGDGDFQSCYDCMVLLFEGCYEPPCNLNDGHKSHPDIKTEQFYAIENFFYTARFFKLDQKNLISSLTEKSSEFCGTDWETLKNIYPYEPLEDLFKYCFSAVYIIRLLEALGFKQPEKNVRVQQSVNNTDIDWALGSVIYEISNKVNSEPSEVAVELEGGGGRGRANRQQQTHSNSLSFSAVSFSPFNAQEQLWEVVICCATGFLIFVLLWRYQRHKTVVDYSKKCFNDA